MPEAPTTVVLSSDLILRLWRATLAEYCVLMDRAERLQMEGRQGQAELLRNQAGNLLRSFPGAR